MEPLVSVDCITYNHAKYIRDALDGFLMQNTKFPFEILIYDAASTDGTQDILKEYEKKYPGRLDVIYQTETNEPFNHTDIELKHQIPRFKGKYVALCRPFSHWFASSKLQLQFDYMETHKSCSCSFHSTIIRNDFKEGYVECADQPWNLEKDISKDEFMSPVPFGFYSCSMFYRKDMADSQPNFLQIADNYEEALKYLLITKGQFHYFPHILASHNFGAKGSFEFNMQDDAAFIAHILTAFKQLCEYNDFTKGKHVVFIGAKIQNYIEKLAELNVLANYPWLLNVLIQTEDKIKTLETARLAAETRNDKKTAKKYKTAQKEYWSWFIQAISENMKE